MDVLVVKGVWEGEGNPLCMHACSVTQPCLTLCNPTQLGESVQERFKGLRKRRDHRRVVFGPNMKSTSPELADRSTRVQGWGVCLTF